MRTEVLVSIVFVSLLASTLYLYHENIQLRRKLEESRSHEWMAFMSTYSNGTHTVISVKIFNKKPFRHLSQLNYLFEGDIKDEKPLLLIGIYSSLYKIPGIKGYEMIMPSPSKPIAKPIENVTQLLIPPCYTLNATFVEKKGDHYAVTIVVRLLLDPKTFKWIPVKKAIFNSTDAAEAIQWAIDHGSGRIEIVNITAVLTHPINITRHDIPIIISGCNFTLEGEKDEN